MRQSRQLELLSRTSQQLNSVLEMPAVLRTLVASGLDLVDASGRDGGLWTGEMMQFTEYNNDGLLQADRIRRSPRRGRVRRGGRDPTAVPGQRSDGGPPAWPPPARTSASATWSTSHLSREGALLGCLEVHNKRRGEPFDEGDVSMLEGSGVQRRRGAGERPAAGGTAAGRGRPAPAEGIQRRHRPEHGRGHRPSGSPGHASPSSTRPPPPCSATTPTNCWARRGPRSSRRISTPSCRRSMRSRRRGGASRYEIEFVRKDGRRLPALVSGNPRFEDGTVRRDAGGVRRSSRTASRRRSRCAKSEEQLRSMAEKLAQHDLHQPGRADRLRQSRSAARRWATRRKSSWSEGFHFESLVAPESMPIVREAFGRHARGRGRTGLRV